MCAVQPFRESHGLLDHEGATQNLPANPHSKLSTAIDRCGCGPPAARHASRSRVVARRIAPCSSNTRSPSSPAGSVDSPASRGAGAGAGLSSLDDSRTRAFGTCASEYAPEGVRNFIQLPLHLVSIECSSAAAISAVDAATSGASAAGSGASRLRSRDRSNRRVPHCESVINTIAAIISVHTNRPEESSRRPASRGGPRLPIGFGQFERASCLSRRGALHRRRRVRRARRR